MNGDDHAAADRLAIARVLAGDGEAFAELVQRHQGRVLAHLRRLAGPVPAEDLCQDAFLRAYQALPDYDPAYPFRGWLLVIASRLAFNAGARLRPQRLGEHDDPADRAETDPAELVASREQQRDEQRRLDAALAALPADARMLYELRFRQELPSAEIARHLDLTENALNVRLHRLRQRLIEALRPTPENRP